MKVKDLEQQKQRLVEQVSNKTPFSILITVHGSRFYWLHVTNLVLFSLHFIKSHVILYKFFHFVYLPSFFD